MASTVDNVISLSKRRGFVYQCGEIYGGTKSAWDYGPLGVELKDNIKRQWWRSMVQGRDDVVGLDSSVILPTDVWKASGHLVGVRRPAGRVPELPQALPPGPPAGGVRREEGHRRPRHGRHGPHRVRQLRHARRVDRAPHVQRAAQDVPRPGRVRRGPALPAPRDRAGHLHQLRPGHDDRRARSRRSASARSARASATRSRRATSSSAPASSSRWRWNSSSSRAPTRSGTRRGSRPAWTGTRASASTPTTCASTSTRRRSSRTTPSARSTSSTASSSPGSTWGELEGIANRTDFDLKTHSEHSGKDLQYFDQPNNERWTPYVIEPAAGVNRSMMAFLIDAYVEEEVPNAKGGTDTRTVLKLDQAPRAGQGRGAAAVAQRGPVAQGACPRR